MYAAPVMAVCIVQNYSMKLVSFSQFDRTGNGVAPTSGSAPEHLGWVQEDQTTVLIVNPDLAGMPASMMEVITDGDAAVRKIASAADQFQSVALDAINLLPPLTDPKGIFCVGLNYAEHEREAPVAGTDYPTIFLRLARNQIAHGQAMVAPDCSPTLDWEGELAAIIGKPGRHIAPENAFDHIFGYSIYNEASVREYQHHSSQFGLGKNFEGTGAFGPCIVTADEFGDPYAHHIKTLLDNETVQSAQISTMLHRIEDVIAYLSSATTLQPGDIICTGTPSGVGAARKPQRFMTDGETVTVEISGIGSLTNPVLAESRLQGA